MSGWQARQEPARRLLVGDECLEERLQRAMRAGDTAAVRRISRLMEEKEEEGTRRGIPARFLVGGRGESMPSQGGEWHAARGFNDDEKRRPLWEEGVRPVRGYDSDEEERRHLPQHTTYRRSAHQRGHDIDCAHSDYQEESFFQTDTQPRLASSRASWRVYNARADDASADYPCVGMHARELECSSSALQHDPASRCRDEPVHSAGSVLQGSASPSSHRPSSTGDDDPASTGDGGQQHAESGWALVCHRRDDVALPASNETPAGGMGLLEGDGREEALLSCAGGEEESAAHEGDPRVVHTAIVVQGAEDVLVRRVGAVSLLTCKQVERQLALRSPQSPVPRNKGERVDALKALVRAEVEERERICGSDAIDSDGEIDRLKALGFGPCAGSKALTHVKEEGSNVLSAPDVYKVERILDVRKGPSGREFLIKWEGWVKRWNSWEPEAHILDRDMLDRFLRKRSRVESTPPRIRSKRSSARGAAEKARQASNADDDNESVGSDSEGSSDD